MAFGFFRRRQKLVVIVMVALMVSFLVGGFLFERVSGRAGMKSPNKIVVGRFRDGTKVTRADFDLALADLQIIDNARLATDAVEAVKFFNRDNPAIVYALLIKESQALGPIGEADVDGLLAGARLVDEEYSRLISILRSRDITERRFRETLKRLILIERAFRESRVATPPSQAELERVFFDLSDLIRIRYLKVPAERFAADVELPQDPQQLDAELEAMFNRFVDRLPGSHQDDNPFGFGYRVPDRVAIEYMLVRADMLERAVVPPERVLSAYYETHRSEFTKQAPTGETDDEGEPIMQTVPKTFGEARREIIQILRPREVAQWMAIILQSASTSAREFDAAATDGQQRVYEYVVEQMQLSADNVLDTSLGEVNIDDELLADVIEFLAERAKIQGICYPLTDSAGQELDSDTRVTIQADNMTLGDALARIAEQLDQPELTWKLCKTLAEPDAILFCAGPLSTFPLMPGRTDLVDQATLFRHPLLGTAGAWSEGRAQNMLVSQAFDPSLFDESALRNSPLSERRFPQLLVPLQTGGLLTWRVSEAVSAYSADTRTPEIDEQVAADLRTIAAMELARQHAERLMDQARQGSLTAVAEDEDLEIVAIEQLRRKVPGPNVFDQDWVWSNVEGLRLPSPAAKGAFITAAFALTGDDASADGQGDGGRFGVLAVPSDRSVCVIELVEHMPAILEQYQADLPMLIAGTEQTRSMRLARVWFSLQGVKNRLGYEESGR